MHHKRLWSGGNVDRATPTAEPPGQGVHSGPQTSADKGRDLVALAPEQTGIGIRRHFTTEQADPYDEVSWERRDARITNYRDGSVAFEQLGVEFPTTWSLNATNIVAQKYFRGTPGTEERETS